MSSDLCHIHYCFTSSAVESVPFTQDVSGRGRETRRRSNAPEGGWVPVSHETSTSYLLLRTTWIFTFWYLIVLSYLPVKYVRVLTESLCVTVYLFCSVSYMYYTVVNVIEFKVLVYFTLVYSKPLRICSSFYYYFLSFISKNSWQRKKFRKKLGNFI